MTVRTIHPQWGGSPNRRRLEDDQAIAVWVEQVGR